MKAVFTLLAVFAVSSVLSRNDEANVHVPAVCFDANGRIITTGPDCTKHFQLSEHKVTWIEAHRNCVAEGKQLASIKTLREQKELEKNIIREDSVAEGFWLGATDRRHQGAYVWIGDNHSEMRFTNWLPGKPDRNVESCLEAGDGLKWIDSDCKLKKRYVCEYYGDIDTDY